MRRGGLRAELGTEPVSVPVKRLEASVQRGLAHAWLEYCIEMVVRSRTPGVELMNAEEVEEVELMGLYRSDTDHALPFRNCRRPDQHRRHWASVAAVSAMKSASRSHP
eukprot:CAMPEP_0174753374 /NCGR_PEP_ID=MMETSP1094-20130205/103939_1 /TAXON_ID=156173 /ORGANISM="Chrysochromulina brevifilum, Strain UTEX LB 985" /LENGTH=107 /DNA_ID=CAMNT_0015959135 /DNA_START=150 /DNA_END=471 /DNA_ORIENTATION=-